MSNFKKVVERYNKLMWEIGCEHVTIGTVISEIESIERWNLRDMVAEAYYWLSCYTESGNIRYEDRLESPEAYKTWLSEKAKLDRFIKRFEKEAMEIEYTVAHHLPSLYGKFAK